MIVACHLSYSLRALSGNQRAPRSYCRNETVHLAVEESSERDAPAVARFRSGRRGWDRVLVRGEAFYLPDTLGGASWKRVVKLEPYPCFSAGVMPLDTVEIGDAGLAELSVVESGRDDCLLQAADWARARVARGGILYRPAPEPMIWLTSGQLSVTHLVQDCGLYFPLDARSEAVEAARRLGWRPASRESVEAEPGAVFGDRAAGATLAVGLYRLHETMKGCDFEWGDEFDDAKTDAGQSAVTLLEREYEDSFDPSAVRDGQEAFEKAWGLLSERASRRELATEDMRYLGLIAAAVKSARAEVCDDDLSAGFGP